jgi:oligoribonuclease
MNELILWMDLETTGLDSDCEDILEVAWIISTVKFEILESGSRVVSHGQERAIGIAKQMYEASKKIGTAWGFHLASGLIWELLEDEGESIEAIEDLILDKIWVKNPTHVYLAGNSVHFDRAFIKAHMKKLDEKLSHRHLDVRVLQTAEKWWMDPYNHTPRIEPKHRAMDDIVYSYETAKQFALKWSSEK